MVCQVCFAKSILFFAAFRIVANLFTKLGLYIKNRKNASMKTAQKLQKTYETMQICRE